MNTSLPQLSIQTFLNPFEVYSDQREQGYQGSSRHVRLRGVTPAGGGLIARCEDGVRCAVTGKESLRILHISEPSQGGPPEHKTHTGIGGHRIDASRNFWESSGLKIDSASTDIAWGHGLLSNKILTAARNGELIMWDINKSGATKLERRTKDHIRAINKMSLSQVVEHYCITGSADGHMRVWDLRTMSKSIMRIAHPTSIRSLIFSPSLLQPLQAVVGLDNGTIYRWDLKMGQRGQLDKLPVAHSASVTTLDWYASNGVAGSINVAGATDTSAIGLGWLVSGGLDRCVKVWDLTSPGANLHIPHKPTYILHAPFPIRRLAWRPGYECELAIVSNTDYSTHTLDVSSSNPAALSPGSISRVNSGLGLDTLMRGGGAHSGHHTHQHDHSGGSKEKQAHLGIPGQPNQGGDAKSLFSSSGDAVEIWDVRRGWLAKWRVTGSESEGGATDIVFSDSHALWMQHASGAFSQLDLRDATKPIDSIPRAAATWEVTGSMAFVVDRVEKWEAPYDDVVPDQRGITELRKPAIKALGDLPARIMTQAIATYASDFEPCDTKIFTMLARRYIFEGRDRKEICAFNAGVALSAGHLSAAQAWLLLGTCLEQYVPLAPPHPVAHPTQSSRSQKIPNERAQSAPSPTFFASASNYAFPASISTGVSPDAATSYSHSPARRPPNASIPGSRLSSYSGSGALPSSINARSSSRSRITPSSSTASSPRRHPTSLPSSNHDSRRSSASTRMDSTDANALGLVESSVLSASFTMTAMNRHPSLPVTPLQGTSPNERSSSMSSSTRHVGEGVLDDSDSEESEFAGDGEDEGEETAGVNSSEDEHVEEVNERGAGRGVLLMGVTAPRPFPTPSPLSRVMRHQVWSEDEDDVGESEEEEGRDSDADDSDVEEHKMFKDAHHDDGYTPSTHSTDSDSTGDGKAEDQSSQQRSKSSSNTQPRRWFPMRNKARSKSFTVASLAVRPRALTHHDSQSSIRTVTAPGSEIPHKDRRNRREDGDNMADMVHTSRNQPEPRAVHNRVRSHTVLDHMANPAAKKVAASLASTGVDAMGGTEKGHDKGKDAGRAESFPDRGELTERRIESIRAEDKRFRETTLGALKDALEEFADEGDIQMCAMLALVSSKELDISQARVSRFLDSYIELLSRFRLYTSAAYLRKYCGVEDVRKPTMLETTIYSTCGKCRKPLLRPAGTLKGTVANKGAFSYCLTCDQSCMPCSICRLPVRALLFHCSLCNHGGHQDCYRQYYFHHRKQELPTTFFPSDNRGRSPLRQSQTSMQDDSSSTISDSQNNAILAPQSESSATIGLQSNSVAGSTSSIQTVEATPDLSPVHSNLPKLLGYQCPAGCGHFCWATNISDGLIDLP